MSNFILLLTKLCINNATFVTIITCYRPPNTDYIIFLTKRNRSRLPDSYYNYHWYLSP